MRLTRPASFAAGPAATGYKIRRRGDLAGMDLTPDQAERLRDSVRGRMGFFHAVKVRMYQRGVGTDDRLFVLFNQAEESLRRLTDELHNRSIVRERQPCEPVGASW
jgi:hypothetical protein